MTLSIWIILAIVVALAFWFFYKKNKSKIKKPVVKTVKKDLKYSLTNIEKMLDNVTQKELQNEDAQSFLNEQEEVLKEIEKKTSDDTLIKQNKQVFDFKSGIITSILLKKKDDL